MLAGVAGVLGQPVGPGGLDVQAQVGMIFAVAGLIGGSCRRAGRIATALGFWLAFVFLRLISLGLGDAWLPEAFGVLLGLALVLPSWSQGARLRDLYARAVQGSVPQPDQPSQSAPASFSPADPIAALAQVLRTMRRGLPGQAATEVAATIPDPLAPLVGEVVERVCANCSLYRHCWELQFHRTYQTFTHLWADLEREGILAARGTSPGLDRFCRYPHEALAALNTVFDIHMARQQCERKLKESQALASEHLLGVARLLDDLAAEIRLDPRERRSSARATEPTLSVTTGVARVAKRGSLVSGDGTLAMPLGRRHYLLALSDGMGAGREAAVESRLALESLQALLEAGYSLENAVQAVNTGMVLRQAGDGFATLDVALLDLCTGRAQFAKVGAPPCLLKKGNQVQTVRAEVPPAGILQPLPLELQERTLHPGDWIILISDGLWEVGHPQRRAGDWLFHHLQGDHPGWPSSLAEALLARALEEEETPQDDMTVLVAYVDVAGQEGAAAGRAAGAAAVRPARPVPARRAPRQ